MRWNFSSRARELSGGDAVVISIPKSGRTWARTFLNAYFAYKKGKQFSLDFTDRGEAGVPRIVYSHDRFEDRTKGNAWDRLRGKYLIPRRSLRTSADRAIGARSARCFRLLFRPTNATQSRNAGRDQRDVNWCIFAASALWNRGNGRGNERLDRGIWRPIRFFDCPLRRTARRPGASYFTNCFAPSAKSKSTMRCLVRRSIFPIFEICKSWKQRAISDRKFCNRAIGRTRKPSKSGRVNWGFPRISFRRRPELRGAGLCRAQSAVRLQTLLPGPEGGTKPPASHCLGIRHTWENQKYLKFLLDG